MAQAGQVGAGQSDQPASAVALRAVQYCRGAIGTPYVWGGTTPNGYDCSGLVYAAYQNAGMPIPRTSEEQWAGGFVDVPWGAWAPGDLIFSQWPGDGASPGHVVIYAGGGSTIAAPHTGTTVQYEPVSTFARPHYVGSKRPSPLKGAPPPVTPTPTPSSTSSSGAGGGTAGLFAGLGVGTLAFAAIAGIAVLGVVILVVRSRHKSGQAPATEGSGGGA